MQDVSRQSSKRGALAGRAVRLRLEETNLVVLILQERSQGIELDISKGRRMEPITVLKHGNGTRTSMFQSPNRRSSKCGERKRAGLAFGRRMLGCGSAGKRLADKKRKIKREANARFRR